MNSEEIFDWTYTPADYFEESFEIVRDDYIMSITLGKVEARVLSKTFDANPAIRDEMQATLNDRFLGAQLIAFRPYELSDSRRTRIHADGQKEIFIELKSATAIFTGGTVDIRLSNADGVIYDSKSERVVTKRELAELIQLYRPLSTVLSAMLTSFGNAIRDPQNELVHLYEVRDALSVEFGGKSNAIRILKLSTSAWSRLGQLSNDEPLRQGRHRGKNGNSLRDATHEELQEARDIARSMLSHYVEHLADKNKS